MSDTFIPRCRRCQRELTSSDNEQPCCWCCQACCRCSPEERQLAVDAQAEKEGAIYAVADQSWREGVRPATCGQCIFCRWEAAGRPNIVPHPKGTVYAPVGTPWVMDPATGDIVCNQSTRCTGRAP